MRNEAANARKARLAAANRLIHPGQQNPVELKILKPAPMRRVAPKPANLRIDVAKVATT